MHPNLNARPGSGQASSTQNFDPDYVRRTEDRALRSDLFFSFRQEFYWMPISKMAALLLQQLINWHSHTADKLGVNKRSSYLLCTSGFLENGRWTLGEQRIHLTALQDAGYISIKRIGLPGKRHILVCYDAIHQAMDKASLEMKETPGFNWMRESCASRVVSDMTGRVAHDTVKTTNIKTPNTTPPDTTRGAGSVGPLGVGGGVVGKPNKGGTPSNTANLPTDYLPSGNTANTHDLSVPEESDVAGFLRDDQIPGPKGKPTRRFRRVLRNQSEGLPTDTQWAQFLFDKLRAYNKVKRNVSMIHWAHEFLLLRKEYPDVPLEEIEEALLWYCRQVKKTREERKGVPEIYSAAAFRQKFQKVRSAMERAGASKPKEVELDESGQHILAEVEHLGWPKGTKSQLKEVIQASMNNFRTFQQKVRAVGDLPRTDKLYTLHEVVCGHVRRKSNVSSFLIFWLKGVHKQIADWSDFSGNLRSYIWRLDHKMNLAVMEGWAVSCSGKTERWSQYLALLEKD